MTLRKKLIAEADRQQISRVCIEEASKTRDLTATREAIIKALCSLTRRRQTCI